MRGIYHTLFFCFSSQAHEFLPLVDIKCSEHVRLFICSVFAPMCTPEIPYGVVPPCRSLCEHVKSSCLPILLRLNFTWPAVLECQNFPQNDLCMNPVAISNQDNPLEVIKEDNEATDRFPFHLCSGTQRIWIPTHANKGLCAPLCDETFLYSQADKRIAVVSDFNCYILNSCRIIINEVIGSVHFRRS